MNAPPCDLLFVPLGGANEIGMNCYMYGEKRGENTKWLMVDLGMAFPDSSMPGIDKVLPDVGFAENNVANLEGIVITHAHEDHSGALAALWPQLRVPVYMTQFAWELVRNRLDSVPDGLADAINIIPPGSEFRVGVFDLAFVEVPHSIPQAQALALRFDQGTVIHSGDWKTQAASSLEKPFDEKRFLSVMRGECIAMICDSTNAMLEGVTASEDSLHDSFVEQFRQAPARVALTTFSSNLGRLLSVYSAAEAAGRKVAVFGRAMQRTLNAARACGLISDSLPVVEPSQVAGMKRDKVVLLTTGSQGEQEAAIAKLSRGKHPLVQLDVGDRVLFSSRTIPGNEASVLAVQNRLVRQGIEVISADEAHIHVSGHPRKDEIKRLYSAINPRLLVPVHGEARHTDAQITLAREFGIPVVKLVENGSMICLNSDRCAIVDDVPVGIFCVDGKIPIRPDNRVLSERRQMALMGFVAVWILCDRNGSIVDPVGVICHGIPNSRDIEDMIADLVFEQASASKKKLRGGNDRELNSVENNIRRLVRNRVASIWGKKPSAVVQIEIS